MEQSDGLEVNESLQALDLGDVVERQVWCGGRGSIKARRRQQGGARGEERARHAMGTNEDQPEEQKKGRQTRSERREGEGVCEMLGLKELASSRLERV